MSADSNNQRSIVFEGEAVVSELYLAAGNHGRALAPASYHPRIEYFKRENYRLLVMDSPLSPNFSNTYIKLYNDGMVEKSDGHYSMGEPRRTYVATPSGQYLVYVEAGMDADFFKSREDRKARLIPNLEIDPDFNKAKAAWLRDKVVATFEAADRLTPQNTIKTAPPVQDHAESRHLMDEMMQKLEREVFPDMHPTEAELTARLERTVTKAREMLDGINNQVNLDNLLAHNPSGRAIQMCHALGVKDSLEGADVVTLKGPDANRVYDALRIHGLFEPLLKQPGIERGSIDYRHDTDGGERLLARIKAGDVYELITIQRNSDTSLEVTGLNTGSGIYSKFTVSPGDQARLESRHYDDKANIFGTAAIMENNKLGDTAKDLRVLAKEALDAARIGAPLRDTLARHLPAREFGKT